jgi:hypothetical protein
MSYLFNLFPEHFFYEKMELQTGTLFFGMQNCFWYAALLQCTIVHYLAPLFSVLSMKYL